MLIRSARCVPFYNVWLTSDSRFKGMSSSALYWLEVGSGPEVKVIYSLFCVESLRKLKVHVLYMQRPGIMSIDSPHAKWLCPDHFWGKDLTPAGYDKRNRMASSYLCVD